MKTKIKIHVQIQIQIHEAGLLVSKPGLLMVQSQSQSHSHTDLGLGRRPIVGVKTFFSEQKRPHCTFHRKNHLFCPTAFKRLRVQCHIPDVEIFLPGVLHSRIYAKNTLSVKFAKFKPEF